MGGAELVASLVASLAWPVVTLLLVPLIVFSFEGEIRGLFSRITRVSLQGNYVDFSPLYDPEPIPVPNTDEKPTDGEGFVIPDDQPPPAEDYIEANPHLAVLQSWRNLERFAFQLLPLLVGPTGENPTLTELLLLAVQKEILNRNDLATITALAEVRNRVAHGAEERIKPNDARFYVDRVSYFIKRLGNAVNDWQTKDS